MPRAAGPACGPLGYWSRLRLRAWAIALACDVRFEHRHDVMDVGERDPWGLAGDRRVA